MTTRMTIAAVAAFAIAGGMATGIARADTAATESGSLDEIIVTAQKREQRLTDVPVAMTVETGKELQEKQVSTLDQLTSIVPDIKVNTPYAGAVQNITLRGIGPANIYDLNTNAPVGLYMDEIYQSFAVAPGVQFFDLERLEVLKGPQGTLYGRNTTGGLINFISQDPNLSGGYNGNLDVGYGNFHSFRVEGATDIQLVPDVLAARIAVFHSNGDGYLVNVGSIGPRTFDSDDTTQGRLTIKYQPTDNFNATLRLYSNYFNGSGAAFVGAGVLPGYKNVVGLSRAGLGPYDIVTDFDDPATQTKSSDLGLTLNWTQGAFTVTSITSDEGSRAPSLADDCDGTAANLCEIRSVVSAHQFSEDFRVRYSQDKNNLLVGAYYGRDTLAFLGNVGFFDAAFLEPSYEQIRKSFAIYADDSYQLTDRWELTAGLRETYDKEFLDNAQTLLLDSFQGTPVASTIPTSGTYVPGLVLPDIENRPHQLTGRLVLRYKFTPDVVGYVSASHGYREGAYNGEAFFSEAELKYVGPEKIDNYEIGLKAALLDNKVEITNALFFMPVRGQQVLTTVAVVENGVTVGSSPELAGLDGRSYGYEFDGRAALNDAVTSHLSFTALNTRYNDGQTLNFVNVSGNHFANAPPFAAQAGIDWKLWRSLDGAVVTFSPDVAYSGRTFLDPENGKELSSLSAVKFGQPAYTLLNARLSYQQGRWSVGVWGKNLTNKYYFLYNGNAESSDFSDGLVPAAPRTYGGTVSVKF